MGIRSFFDTIAETKEIHVEESMRTHYFRHSYKHVRDEFISYAEKKGYTVKNVNDTHHEIFIQHKNHYIIATVTQINPVETALDLKVGMEALFGLNRPKKIIAGIYADLKKSMTFKGVGLHA